MKIVVEGCAHGELDKIYEAVEFLQHEHNIKIDMLICCGDFQAVRNPQDLKCMAVPPKYQTMNTFYKYYSGEKTAPLLTLFIGGNHEASNYLGELAYGGWVAPNIYYMGYASVVNVLGVRIAGISGIYKGEDYLKGHHEFPPYDRSTMRSAYHVRNQDVFRMKQITQHLDIVLSHDWPRGVYNYGDTRDLLRRKRFFTEEVEQNKLGSRPNQELLEKLQPSYWFAAHLHVKFAALVPHVTEENNGVKKVTKFLALDKCLPRRDFLQVLDVGSETPAEGKQPDLHYDAEWLAILRSTNHLLNVSCRARYMPGPGSDERWDFQPSDEELTEVVQLFDNDLKIPLNFCRTADIHCDPSTPASSTPTRSEYPQSPRDGSRTNPQTTEFCRKLGIDDPFQLLSPATTATTIREPKRSSAWNQSFRQFASPSELNVTACSTPPVNESGGDDLFFRDVSASSTFVSSYNEDENSSDDEYDDVDDTTTTSLPPRARPSLVIPAPRSSISGTLPRSQDVSTEDPIACSPDDDGIFASSTSPSMTYLTSDVDSASVRTVDFLSPLLTPSSGILTGGTTSADPSPITPSGGLVKKTFKRRNQALYEPPKDDSDDD